MRGLRNNVCICVLLYKKLFIYILHFVFSMALWGINEYLYLMKRASDTLPAMPKITKLLSGRCEIRTQVGTVLPEFIYHLKLFETGKYSDGEG